MAGDEQVLMTLAALAPTASTTLPGESAAAQANRIASGIATQLAMADLATAGQWQLAWLGLSDDTANLAYVAANPTANAFAVVLRGTIESWTDAAEDLRVGKVVPFPQSGDASVQIAAGALEAFIEVTSATCALDGNPLAGTTLLEGLAVLLKAAPQSPTLYVTGHSLGGALATTVALYLAAHRIRSDLATTVWTFAAPTAGLASFAKAYDTTFGSAAYRTYNAYDIVPLAWENLLAATQWYPPPGPVASDLYQALIERIDGLRGGNVYVQPSANPHELNANFHEHAPVTSATSFLDQVGFQHHSTTYLTLLGAPLPPAWPVVHVVSPHHGSWDGGTQVTVTGSGFTDDCLVYFGDNAATDVQFVSATELVATAPPAGLGPVDVRVTTFVGTSAAAFDAIFVYLP